MKPILSKAIILSRVNYGEADRIITLLTPEHGKLRLMARGVRKIKSKLAGGIELFSVSDITFIEGRGEIGTLVSSRLIRHYGQIVGHIDRVQLGYGLIKMLHKATEDQPETEYFELLERAFMALDNAQIDSGLVTAWFQAQLLTIAGHRPNLSTTSQGIKLTADTMYAFDFETMAFEVRPDGSFSPELIKFLRLLFSSTQPKVLERVQGSRPLTISLAPLIKTMLTTYIRV